MMMRECVYIYYVCINIRYNTTRTVQYMYSTTALRSYSSPFFVATAAATAVEENLLLLSVCNIYSQ